MMDALEVKLRCLELAAKTYGGLSSVHLDAKGIAELATSWYNGLCNSDPADKSTSTLGLPKRK
jgi:hypothetical protein